MVNIFFHEIEKINLKLEKMHCKLQSSNNINNYTNCSKNNLFLKSFKFAISESILFSFKDEKM